uniref:Uncharacterized protein n=1 Tax=Marseillevirus LCMAC101 TaxID=2506602 RepID=A0A481YT00_9VIRU|nr:MAG: hypothetical protein LCMAC101_06820 [Marseillevirus LCMAC101]
MDYTKEFVWLLFHGCDDESENFQDSYSSEAKAKKGAQEIMDGYTNPSNNWWEMKQDKDGIIWHWFYDFKERKKDPGDYVQILKSKVK